MMFMHFVVVILKYKLKDIQRNQTMVIGQNQRFS